MRESPYKIETLLFIFFNCDISVSFVIGHCRRRETFVTTCSVSLPNTNHFANCSLMYVLWCIATTAFSIAFCTASAIGEIRNIKWWQSSLNIDYFDVFLVVSLEGVGVQQTTSVKLWHLWENATSSTRRVSHIVDWPRTRGGLRFLDLKSCLRHCMDVFKGMPVIECHRFTPHCSPSRSTVTNPMPWFI